VLECQGGEDGSHRVFESEPTKLSSDSTPLSSVTDLKVENLKANNFQVQNCKAKKMAPRIRNRYTKRYLNLQVPFD
jgi:hypothetical protein